jgi:hypothetical protein
VTTVQLGPDGDGDEDLASDEVALSFQACAPPAIVTTSLAVGPVGGAPHLTALGELFFACADDAASLCRLEPATSGATVLEADLDGDGLADARVHGSGSVARVWTGTSGITSLASDGDGNVYVASAGDATVRKLVRAWDAMVDWRDGCAGARLVADEAALYVGCADGALQALAIEASDGSTAITLAVTAMPPGPVTGLATAAGWIHVATDAGFGRLPTGGGRFEPLASTSIGGLASGEDGALWFTDGGALRVRRADGTLATPAVPVAWARELALRGSLLAVRDATGKVTLVDVRAR